MNNTCKECKRISTCTNNKTFICNQFELHKDFVDKQKEFLINERRKKSLKNYFMNAIDAYMKKNPSNEIQIWYSLDQDKFIIRQKRDNRSVGNWINIPIDLTKVAILRENYDIHNSFLSQTFENFFRIHSYKPITHKALKLF